MSVYIEVVKTCLDCGYINRWFQKHPQADCKSDINEHTDEECGGWTSHPHPCGTSLGGRMRSAVRAVEPPKGSVAIGCEKQA